MEHKPKLDPFLAGSHLCWEIFPVISHINHTAN